MEESSSSDNGPTSVADLHRLYQRQMAEATVAALKGDTSLSRQHMAKAYTTAQQILGPPCGGVVSGGPGQPSHIRTWPPYEK